MTTFTETIKKNTFPKKFRLRKRYEFISIQRSCLKLKTNNLILIVRTAFNFHNKPKIGFTVTKRIGKANIRNLIKRRLRHISRENFVCWKNYQIVILARPYSAKATFVELKSNFLYALNQINKKFQK